MALPYDIDGVLVQWGDRLFYPANRTKKGVSEPRMSALSTRQRAAEIRRRILATVVRRAPQVMVKVTGGGRGMLAIAAHFRYISKNGKLDIEDEQQRVERGREAVSELVDNWRFGGSLIEEGCQRREAFNIMLSMPRGTDPLSVQRAAREFARVELADHKYVMVLHDHQANPHVHLSVRAESRHGKRLNPRKQDLRRWRETFAEKVRELGVEAEASPRHVRGRADRDVPLWRLKAREDGRLRSPVPRKDESAAVVQTPRWALEAWTRIGAALKLSSAASDQDAAKAIAHLVGNQSGRAANGGSLDREGQGAGMDRFHGRTR